MKDQTYTIEEVSKLVAQISVLQREIELLHARISVLKDACQWASGQLRNRTRPDPIDRALHPENDPESTRSGDLLSRNRILQSDQKRLEAFAKTYRQTAEANGIAAHSAQCKLMAIRDLVTTDHESKESFIARVISILNTENEIAQTRAQLKQTMATCKKCGQRHYGLQWVMCHSCQKTTEKEEAESRRSAAACSALQKCAQRVAGHIANPLDIDAIVAEVESNDYNAELMLQHLILWASKITD